MNSSMGRTGLLGLGLLWCAFLVDCASPHDEWQSLEARSASFPASPFANSNGTDLQAGLSCIVDPYFLEDNPPMFARDICSVAHESAVTLSQKTRHSVATRLLLVQPLGWYDQYRRVSFNTFFVFSMLSGPRPPQVLLGSGLAFLIVPNNSFPYGNDVDFNLGLFWANSRGEYDIGMNDSPGDRRTFSVEIDIQKDSYDPAVPHVGVNFRDSLRSVESSYLWDNETFMDSKIAVWIDYDAHRQILQVRMMNVSSASAPDKAAAVLVLTCSDVDLSSIVQQSSYVGFGAVVPQAPAAYVLHQWSIQTFIVPPPPPRPRALWKPITGGLLAGLSLLALCVLLFCVYRRYVERRREVLRAVLPCLSLAEQVDGPRELPFSLLQKATNNFSEDAFIGKGGFGKVYKGVIQGGALGSTTVAVKKVDQRSLQGEREFISEITTIGRLKHKNIVPLKGWCESKDKCLLLVYEYMPNGCLEQHLFGEQAQEEEGDADSEAGGHRIMRGRSYLQAAAGAGCPRLFLTWPQRYHILQGVASALLYMHEEWQGQVVVHRDVKAGNVLLDDKLNARLGDFGLARLVAPDGTSVTVTNPAGTMGYLAPESVMSGKVSAESDVYSFGVLCLEVACGRRSLLHWSVEERVLVTWVWERHLAGRLLDAAHPQLRNQREWHEQLLRVLRLGLLCCVGKPSDRPSMRLVSRYLARSTAPAIAGKLAQLPEAMSEQLYYPGPATIQDVEDIRTS